MFLILTFFFCGTQAKIYEIIKHVPLYLSFVDNLSLLAPSSIDEFKYVFSLMDPNKSLGPYGLNPAFYKKLWNLCGPNIFTATISWLENGSLPQQINQTSIVLIPKIPNPVTMKEFRPISLGNILYKIISKTLANRINPLLTKCIS